jgi:Domain of unknown function (DUF4294)
VRSGFLILLLISVASSASGQVDSVRNPGDSLSEKFYALPEVERNGVKLPEVEIKEVTVFGRSKSTRKRDFRRYENLVSNVKKVYPYALIVRVKLGQVNEELKNIPGDKERRKFIKNVEKEVFTEYEDDIRNMTISQGKLLIKLIDRETQNTSFTLIREYRGKFSAAFWQGVARIFGTNLKEEYDANGEDALIESIINEIDAGRL